MNEDDLTTLEGEEPEGEEPEGNDEPEGDNPEGNGQKPAPTDDKDNNRKGYEIRQQQKAKKESVIASLSKELKEAKDQLSSLSENSKDSEFRKSHSEISDDLFNLIKSTSKGSGKSYEECLSDPIIKGVIDSQTSKTRIDNATPSPSTRTSPAGKTNIWDMSSDEFRAYQDDVLRRQGSN